MVTCRTIAVTSAEYAVEETTIDNHPDMGRISRITTAVNRLYGIIFTIIDVNCSTIGVIACCNDRSVRRFVTTTINCGKGKF